MISAISAVHCFSLESRLEVRPTGFSELGSYAYAYGKATTTGCSYEVVPAILLLNAAQPNLNARKSSGHYLSSDGLTLCN